MNISDVKDFEYSGAGIVDTLEIHLRMSIIVDRLKYCL